MLPLMLMLLLLLMLMLLLMPAGCAVIPLGPAFSLPEVAGFLRQLRPTAVLAMPSFVLALADHVATQQQQNLTLTQTETQTQPQTETEIVIQKVITG